MYFALKKVSIPFQWKPCQCDYFVLTFPSCPFKFNEGARSFQASNNSKAGLNLQGPALQTINQTSKWLQTKKKYLVCLMVYKQKSLTVFLHKINQKINIGVHRLNEGLEHDQINKFITKKKRLSKRSTQFCLLIFPPLNCSKT